MASLGHKLTHWGRVTHICVGKVTIIGSDNGLSPDRRQAIIWTNAGILSIGPLGTKFSEILIAIHVFSFKEMHLKMSSVKWRPSCLGPIVLNKIIWVSMVATSSPSHFQAMAHAHTFTFQFQIFTDVFKWLISFYNWNIYFIGHCHLLMLILDTVWLQRCVH